MPARTFPFVVVCLGCGVPTACTTALDTKQWLDAHDCGNAVGTLDVEWVDAAGAPALGVAVVLLRQGLDSASQATGGHPSEPFHLQSPPSAFPAVREDFDNTVVDPTGYGVVATTAVEAMLVLVGGPEAAPGVRVAWRALPDDRRLVLSASGGDGLVWLSIGNRFVPRSYDDTWLYRSLSSACSAYAQWNGNGEPPGWYRHPKTGRRREDPVNRPDDVEIRP